jgi:hypothetical protein
MAAAAAVRYTKNYEKIKRTFLVAETAGLKNIGRQMVPQAMLNITKKRVCGHREFTRFIELFDKRRDI